MSTTGRWKVRSRPLPVATPWKSKSVARFVRYSEPDTSATAESTRADMPDRNSYTIILEEAGRLHKVTKIVLMGDGGFSVFSPYHGARRGFLAKMTYDYTKVGRDSVT